MKALAAVVKVVGYVWLAAACVLIAVGIAVIWMKEGFSTVAETLSPFNVQNWLAVMATVAPGFGLLMLADWLRVRSSATTPQEG